MAAGEVLKVFARLGVLGFGGPLTVMAMMKEEAVDRLGWLDEKEFGKLLSICKILPGPQATQLAILLATRRAGPWVGAASGVLFFFPAFLCMVALAILIPPGGTAGAGEGEHSTFLPLFLAAMQGGALALILQSVIALSRSHVRGLALPRAWGGICFAVSFAVLLVYPRLEPLVILAFGFFGVLYFTRKPSAPSARAREVASVLVLGWICLEAGALLFGSGLAIVPLLEREFVAARGWISHGEFMEALAFGQITPGPVVITVTYVGYRVAGLLGAVVATAGVFAPSFLNCLYIVPRFLARAGERAGFAIFSESAISSVLGALWATLILLASRQIKEGQSLGPAVAGFALTLGAMVISARLPRSKAPPIAVLLPACAALIAGLLLVFRSI